MDENLLLLAYSFYTKRYMWDREILILPDTQRVWSLSGAVNVAGIIQFKTFDILDYDTIN